MELGVSFISSSLRRSHLSAVRTTRTPGQFSLISAIHFDDTFSKESGLSTYLSKLVSLYAVFSERERCSYTEAEHENMCVLVGQCAQSVELFLAGGIP